MTPAWRLGLLWTVLGAAPMGLVGHHFSAYYVSFSAIGFALLVSAVVARWPMPVVAACFALAAVMNSWANGVEEFKVAAGEKGRPGVSYVTLARLGAQAGYLDSLHAALRADPPPRGATVYVSHAPHYAALASGGNLAPRVWFDDGSLDIVTIGAYRPQTDARPKRFVRFDPARGGFLRIPEPLMEAITIGEEALLLGDCGAAVTQFERALLLSLPGAHDILRIELGTSLGVAAHRCGDVSRADRAWREALDLAPHHREALLNLAALDAAAGRFQQAEAWALRALTRRPTDPLGLLYLARLRHAQGDVAGARGVWTRLRMLHAAFADSVGAAAGGQFDSAGPRSASGRERLVRPSERRVAPQFRMCSQGLRRARLRPGIGQAAVQYRLPERRGSGRG